MGVIMKDSYEFYPQKMNDENILVIELSNENKHELKEEVQTISFVYFIFIFLFSIHFGFALSELFCCCCASIYFCSCSISSNSHSAILFKIVIRADFNDFSSKLMFD